MNAPFNLLVKQISIVILLTFLLFISSCAKDSDLFEYAVEQEIAENIEEEQENEEESSDETETDETSEDPVDVPEDNPDEEDQDFEDTTDRSSPLKAFPTAEGFGKNATGGRGGYVYTVTNLNDSGAGSLRAGIEASGARTIIFNVCGNIYLSNVLQIQNPDITIAGQTAPGDGITLVNNELMIETSNVIVRNIRIRRTNSGSAFSGDGIGIKAWYSQPTENVIIDHCSVSWAVDENIDIGNAGNSTAGVKNITIQNSIISHNSYGVLIHDGAENISMYNNYLAFNSDRNPRVGSPSGEIEITDYLRAEFVNNLVYGFGVGSLITYGLKVSFIGNAYKLYNGQSFSLNGLYEFTTSGEDSGMRPQTEFYGYDNVSMDGLNVETSSLSNYMADAPYNFSDINFISANELPNVLLNNVGTLPNDNLDAELVANWNNGGGPSGNETPPGLNCTSGYSDNDGDGMEDAWELNRGLDPSVPDNNGDDDGDGYTNLEEYLNYLMS